MITRQISSSYTWLDGNLSDRILQKMHLGSMMRLSSVLLVVIVPRLYSTEIGVAIPERVNDLGGFEITRTARSRRVEALSEESKPVLL